MCMMYFKWSIENEDLTIIIIIIIIIIITKIVITIIILQSHTLRD